MGDVHVMVSPEEQAAAGLESPEVIYPQAEGVVRDGLLVVFQDYTSLAEYPGGRYLSWTLVEEEAPHEP